MSVRLFTRIAEVVPQLGGWTSVEKAQTFACIILGLRPENTVEIGAWYGRGALSMGMAHKEVGRGMCYAIDAWSPEASAEGQVHEGDKKHWLEADHEVAYVSFIKNIHLFGLSNCVRAIRSRSDLVQPPPNIGLLVVDGNHGEMAVNDVSHYGPNVKQGGVVYLDDLDWSGGGVQRAAQRLRDMRFVELYRFETGIFFQRL